MKSRRLRSAERKAQEYKDMWERSVLECMMRSRGEQALADKLCSVEREKAKMKVENDALREYIAAHVRKQGEIAGEI